MATVPAAPGAGAADLVTLRDVLDAQRRIQDQVHRTPCLTSRTFSRLCGGQVWLKYENQQRTGSYKIRGALNRLLTLPEAVRRRGVIAASAGNHAQGVAVAAQIAGVPATIVTPRQASMAKVGATRDYGARVILHGDTLEEALDEARRLAAQEGLSFVHAFDDAAVMAGQGTVALEILEAAPDLALLVLPIGGGGLIAGCSAAAKALRPDIQVIGVQASGAAATYLAYHDQYSGPLQSINTIADGLATRAHGEQTLGVIRRYVDDVVTVDDEAIAQAVVLLMERAKTVAEPSGAVALAALLSGAVQLNGRRACAVVTGGNVDLNLVDRILTYGLGAAGRHLRLRIQVLDRPGALQHITTTLAEQNANILEVVHHRIAAAISVNEVDIEFVLEVRDREHGETVLRALRQHGFDADILHLRRKRPRQGR